MTRDEHIKWCKDRALDYAKNGDLKNAIVSMLSDLTKHTKTQDHIGGQLGVSLMLSGMLRTRAEVTEWINGFN